MIETNINGKTPNIAEENIQKLKRVFPDVFTEGKVDFEKLQQVLGNYVEDSNERYNFTWNGKGRALRLSQTPSQGTLRPFPSEDESKEWNTTQNLYIEGDNLEVLKLLQKSYHGKVKMIYIDPPYNTGKDFVYPDDFKDSLENYKKITGQVDIEGNRLGTNTEASGRYHTDWLNMMYPRLRLARNILSDDGVIFASIDDNELDNLKKMCNEIFGEDNFIAKIIHKNNSMKNQTKLIGVTTEYILVYCKDKESLKNIEWRVSKKGAQDISLKFNQLKEKGLTLDEITSEIKEMYSRPKYSHLSRWNKVDENGVFKDADLSRENGYKDFTIINPETGKPCVIPNRGWGKSYDELLKLQDENLIWYGNEDTPPGMKDYITVDDVSVPDNFWYFDNSVDTRWIKSEFGKLVFENPKPLEMIKQLMTLHLLDNDIIVDFFSGSATTAHALMKLNAEDGGNRKYIMVQLPELTDKKSEAYKAGYMNICEIGKERIRRAGEKIKQEIGLEAHNLDIGFKVLKLDTSNIRKWQPDYENLERSLLDHISNYVDGRTELDVVYEIMLKYGLDLTYPVDEYTIAQKKVYSIGFGMLMICLDDEITVEVARGILEQLKELAPESTRVVFKDNGFKEDKNKTNIKEILKCGGIEEFITL